MQKRAHTYLKTVMGERERQTAHHCSLVKDQPIQIGSIIYLVSTNDMTYREAIYRNSNKRNECQIVDAGHILHTLERPASRTHELMQQFTDTLFSPLDLVCTSLDEAVRVRQQLIAEEVQHIGQLRSTSQVNEYLRTHAVSDSTILNAAKRRMYQLRTTATKRR